jgi:hypothetical protein
VLQYFQCSIQIAAHVVEEGLVSHDVSWSISGSLSLIGYQCSKRR